MHSKTINWRRRIRTYLSGEIDSGSITALASKEMNNIKSLHHGFDLSSIPELN